MGTTTSVFLFLFSCSFYFLRNLHGPGAQVQAFFFTGLFDSRLGCHFGLEWPVNYIIGEFYIHVESRLRICTIGLKVFGSMIR